MNKKRKYLTVIIIFYLVLLLAAIILVLPSIFNVIREMVMFELGTNGLLAIFGVLVAATTVLIVMLIMVNSQKEIKSNSLIDDERYYLELKINELNEKLISNEQRWNEAYHLVIGTQNKQINKNPKGSVSVSAFLQGFGIDVDNINVDTSQVFVLTPFNVESDMLYNTIREVCGQAKLIAKRSDDEFVENDIMQHIVKNIVSSRIVIANLNYRNPNVFYELGIAHALNKPTILLAERNSDVPFDLQNQYIVLYKNQQELEMRLFDAILKIMSKNK